MSHFFNGIKKNNIREEHSYTVGKNVNCHSHYGKQYGCSSENQKYAYHMIPLLCISGKNYNSKKKKKRYTHPYVHSSTIHNSQDMEIILEGLSTDKWIKKIYVGIHHI